MDTKSEPSMERVELQPGLEVSRIVYGTWRLGDDADTSPGHVRAKIEACLEQGITTIDQADIYGGYEAEEILGNALRGTGLRDRLEVVTKCGIVEPAGRHTARARLKHYDTGRAHIEHSIDHSLRLMGIDRIDLLLIHRPDPLMDPDETGRALNEAVRSGKVRAVGVSNFRPWDFTLLQSRMETPLVTNQIELGLLHTDAVHERRPCVPARAAAETDGVVAAGGRGAGPRRGRRTAQDRPRPGGAGERDRHRRGGGRLAARASGGDPAGPRHQQPRPDPARCTRHPG